MGDDFLSSLSDDASPEVKPRRSWKVLVVDDDSDVHKTTKLVLNNRRILGRPVELIHAETGLQALHILDNVPDIAVLLLDVVMETESAGLDIVEHIRDELKLTALRIILRTGQPGYAPEVDVISRYDINDYHTKSELSAVRLITSMTAAVRTYEQIQTIETSRSGLNSIVLGSADLFSKRSLKKFAEGVLEQINSLLEIQSKEGIVVLRRSSDEDGDGLDILAGTGRWQEGSRISLNEARSIPVLSAVQEAIERGETVTTEEHTALFIERPSGEQVVVCFENSEDIHHVQQQLLEVFSVNVATGFDSIDLFEKTNTLANNDPLTGFLSRNGLIGKLDSGKDKDRSVIVVDLDDFQSINDGLGVAIGNSVLQRIVGRLFAAFPTADIARLYGDTFAISIADAFDLDEVETRLNDIFSRPFEIEGNQVRLSATYGACAHEGTEDPEDTIQRALMAMKGQKQSSLRDLKVFDIAMRREARRRQEILAGLQNAVENDRLRLMYQPIINLQTDRAIGFEALLRWQADDGTIIPPDDFIPIAEASGLINQLGRWTFRTISRDLSLMQELLPDLYIAVNVSARQIEEGSALTGLMDELDTAQIAANCISVEVTESLAMAENAKPVLDSLNSVRNVGLGLSLDDFGTGHSSLGRLKDLPVNQLKIDGSFVQDMETNERRRAIVESVLHMAKSLDLDVVAEGIETEAQITILRELDCPKVQGFYFSKPLYLPDALDYLKQNLAGP